MNLVEDWKQARKWLSVQIPIAGAGLLGAYTALPQEWRALIPEWVIVTSAIVFLVGGALGRVVDQGAKK